MTEATSIATIFEDFAIDHTPDGWPAVKQMHLNAAAAELRRLHAENEALKSREPSMVGRPLSMLGMPARIESLEAENESLRKALEQPAVEPVAWTPVANGLPASGVVVLACYRNGMGNLRRIRAEWVAAKTQEVNGSDECECAEYDEATDTVYIAQGWYERIDNWGDYSSVAVTEGEVTHWMPLPPAPDAACAN